MKTLRDIDVRGKVVLVRVDYNVPLYRDESGDVQVENDLRIRASLPTLRYLEEHEAKKIVLIAHLGRPAGVEEGLSLRPVAERLTWLLAEDEFTTTLPRVASTTPVVTGSSRSISAVASERPAKEQFVDASSAVGPVFEIGNTNIELLENLRFDKREEENSEEFAKEIIAKTGAEVFVQDGFGVVHRAHTSTEALAKLLPSVAGLLVEKEVETLSRAINNPERPFMVVIGGAKVDDKAPLIDKFEPIADKILVGGKIAADEAVKASEKIYVAEDFDEDAEGHKLDIGPVSTAEIMKAVMGAKTVLWNGVLGKVEDAAFATGSEILAKYLGEHAEITSIICGGDTAGFVTELMEQDPELSYSLVSTGGGAALEFLLGEKLPGLAVL